MGNEGYAEKFILKNRHKGLNVIHFNKLSDEAKNQAVTDIVKHVKEKSQTEREEYFKGFCTFQHHEDIEDFHIQLLTNKEVDEKDKNEVSSTLSAVFKERKKDLQRARDKAKSRVRESPSPQDNKPGSKGGDSTPSQNKKQRVMAGSEMLKQWIPVHAEDPKCFTRSENKKEFSDLSQHQQFATAVYIASDFLQPKSNYINQFKQHQNSASVEALQSNLRYIASNASSTNTK